MSIMDNISENVIENNLLTIMETHLPKQVRESESPSQSLNSSQIESTSKSDEHYSRNNDKEFEDPASIDSFRDEIVVLFGEDKGPNFYPITDPSQTESTSKPDEHYSRNNDKEFEDPVLFGENKGPKLYPVTDPSQTESTSKSDKHYSRNNDKEFEDPASINSSRDTNDVLIGEDKGPKLYPVTDPSQTESTSKRDEHYSRNNDKEFEDPASINSSRDTNDVLIGEDKGPKLYPVTDPSQTESTSKRDEHCSRNNDKEFEDPASIDSSRDTNVVLFGEDKGPKFYSVTGNVVTPVIITKNIPEAFKSMPVYGKPESKDDLEEFQDAKIREFVGSDLNGEDYNKLAYSCSPSHLKVGTEIKMSTKYPTQEHLTDAAFALQDNDVEENLCIVKKLKLRLEKDDGNLYTKQLKYRGIRCFQPPRESRKLNVNLRPLEPGKDLIFHVRVYRPFYYNKIDRHNTRHSLFCNDIVLLGRTPLTQLRDRMTCPNDGGTRVDVSENPDVVPLVSAKEMFPSGFLFINNVFYVDRRAGCKDYSEGIREWASRLEIGDFPCKDLKDFTLDEIPLKLGHPDVYYHQGNCEHLFTFSEVRLLSASDPLQQSLYPFHTRVCQNQILYCTTCAEFGAKWIVEYCEAAPFQPGYFCDTCFRLYLFIDGVKIDNFKAYAYKGNETNLLKPIF